ncbi:MAG: M28 family peptidase, partial [Terriglobales bacterium]
RRCIGSFMAQCHFPSEGVAAPEMFRDIHRSDHWSFWQFGYPGLMITDTSNFRNKVYHTGKDTPSIIDFPRLARVAAGLSQMIHDLAVM